MGFLGIDTSNYTTSVAFLRDNSNIMQSKMPLPVAAGTLGLRQSDAVFAHVKQLGGLIKQLLLSIDEDINAVGVSVSPRDEAGSYMPCFLVGKMCAESISAVLHTPLYEFSHQSGHIAAAIRDTKQDALFSQEFLAFHVSGGTTQCLLVSPDEKGEKPFEIATISQSLDLYAGQVIDRVGTMLGLKFPAGAGLEKLASASVMKYPVKIAFKGLDCCLSGIENQCRKLLEEDAKPCDIARFCIDSVEHAILGMTERVISKYPDKKLLYAGGVMSNVQIRECITRKFSAAFASPAFSSDNAAGIAVLCEKMYTRSRT